MTESASALGKDSASSPSDLVDRFCDRFETLLRQGGRPRIEDYLLQCPEAARDALLRELVLLELDFFRTQGETLPLAPYYARFPTARSVLDALKPACEPQQDDLLPPQPAPQDETIAFDGDGTTFRQFHLAEVVGKGTFGIVWRARDTRLQREVALKFPRREQMATIEKSLFLREARAAAKLNHPNIVAVYEVGDEDKLTFIVSEFVNGQSLKEQLQSASMSARDAASLVAKLASAVHYAHQQGVIHRDLKPANILIDRNGEPHIADFGLAKREADDQSLSIAGKLMGTPAYMAPEQASGDHRAIDARTDVYALGVILYELLTGSRPFTAELSILLRQIQDSAPPAPKSIKPEIPKDLEQICLKCLEKDRGKRYASAKALADDLHHFLNGETLSGIPAPIHDRAWKWLRRHRRQVVFATTVFVGSLFAAGLYAWLAVPDQPPSELRSVRFETNPAGCEITVVKIDPQTGEPDPTKIENAKGVTPLTMKLLPGDYLVVAVLATDDTWFHEVYRHVPSKEDGMAYSSPHLYWHLTAKGEVETRVIQIPHPKMFKEMVFVESGENIIEPTSRNSQTKPAWRIPAFYVDRHEMRHDELDKDESAAIFHKGGHALMMDLKAIGVLESQGKRLPAAAELFYLSKVICPKDPCQELDLQEMEGLNSGAWEWTSTKPGGPFSGTSPVPKELEQGATWKMIGAGSDENREGIATPTGMRLPQQIPGMEGVRGVRSAKPRRAPQDYISTVDGENS